MTDCLFIFADFLEFYRSSFRTEINTFCLQVSFFILFQTVYSFLFFSVCWRKVKNLLYIFLFFSSPKKVFSLIFFFIFNTNLFLQWEKILFSFFSESVTCVFIFHYTFSLSLFASFSFLFSNTLLIGKLTGRQTLAKLFSEGDLACWKCAKEHYFLSLFSEQYFNNTLHLSAKSGNKNSWFLENCLKISAKQIAHSDTY